MSRKFSTGIAEIQSKCKTRNVPYKVSEENLDRFYRTEKQFENKRFYHFQKHHIF